MANVAEALNRALRHHQAGRLQAAEQIYRQVLATDPRNADAWHLLGVAALQQGRHAEAVEHLRRAIGVRGKEAVYHNSLGNAYRALGQLAQAMECYQQAVKLKPEYAEAHLTLGNVWRSQGNLDQAIACYRRAVQAKPGYAEAHFNQGIAWKGLGKLDEAIQCYQRTVQLRPDFAEAHNNLGNAWKEQGQFAAAIECYQRAVQLKPGFAEAHNNLGAAWQARGELDRAVECYQRAVQIHPNYAEAHNNLGNAWRERGELQPAIECYRRAAQLKPDNAEVLNNLGIAWHGLGRLDEAIRCCQQAMQLKPHFAEACANLGNMLKSQGRLEQATECYRQALEWKPERAESHYNLGGVCQIRGEVEQAIQCYRRAWQLHPQDTAALGALVHQLQHVCAWDELKPLVAQVMECLEGGLPGFDRIAPFCAVTLATPTTAQQQLHCAQGWVQTELRAAQYMATPQSPGKAQPKSPLTVGYLSSDFHAHATAWLIAELFEKHDRQRFTVCGYSYGPDDESPMRRRLMRAFDRFVDLRTTSFPEAAQRIAQDGVDILVDLKGYTTDSRAEILALRPAPIQVNYLGYPGTMGAAFMDYILVDHFIVPPDQQPCFSEQLVHLPGCYQVNDRQREIAGHTPTRAEVGLPQEGFVFCCFNNSYKITPEMFDVWMRLLQAVPGSVLWLLERNRTASLNLRREAEKRGVPGDRLVFGPKLPLAEHLARHRLVDLFLDTYPVTAHTTTSDALWAGCVLLTMVGQTFVSRVAGSLLQAVGLPELITYTLAEYEEMALRLAREPDRLAELRARLQANRLTCSLFDSARFTRHVERAYERMWEIYVSGGKPQAFAVQALEP